MASNFFVNGENPARSTLTAWFDKTLDDLQPWASEQIYWLNDEEWVTHSQKLHSHPTKYQEYRDKLFYFVDGTVIGCNTPADPVTARVLHNTKHSKHSFVYFIVCAPSGRIVYLSKRFQGGHTHDKTHWENEQVCKMLERMYPNGGEVVVNGKTYYRELGGDKAYPFASAPKGWRWRITKSGEETRDVGPDGKELESGKTAVESADLKVAFDPEVARPRGVVERSVLRSKLPAIFKNESFCSFLKRVKKMVKLQCAIHNFLMEFLGQSQI
eukprot:CAMPEP_0201518690 /NCGR_PEP_ID=MMETSP0161_2-20130828/9462_1 /ASSEMBLY_ACC=CAM_ASM_000251 /TAXON_ID=180227 /ORGANISM="Neoparamoeba aestuarina, Strain SoJaBio B1-5/56/2" /LENGTH=269 /DNA_ID=CAMNT_0047916529 /DNA_START=173 /DNA_END=982 /DNA_ORIENTATION=-